MWTDTAVTRRLRLDAPIVQGPFGGGLSAVDLVVAVSESGGLGSFGVHHLDAAGIRDVTARIRARTNKPFALNLWIPFRDSDDPHMTDAQWQAAVDLLAPYYRELDVPPPKRPARFSPRYDEQIETVIESKPAVFSFVFGVPSASVLERCRSAGIATLGAATTAYEAKLLADAGVDMIVATGFEAGGHRVSFLREPEDCLTGTLSLVPQVVDTVKVPVIAAGGMADGRGIAAALQLGAAAAQIGTAFLACEESNAHALHRAKLFGPRGGAHLAHARVLGTTGAQRAQRFRRRDARQGAPVRSLSRPELAQCADSGRGAGGRAHGHRVAVVGAGRAAAEASPRRTADARPRRGDGRAHGVTAGCPASATPRGARERDIPSTASRPAGSRCAGTRT
jgi:nitronate monooxygenase